MDLTKYFDISKCGEGDKWRKMCLKKECFLF